LNLFSNYSYWLFWLVFKHSLSTAVIMDSLLFTALGSTIINFGSLTVLILLVPKKPFSKPLQDATAYQVLSGKNRLSFFKGCIKPLGAFGIGFVLMVIIYYKSLIGLSLLIVFNHPAKQDANLIRFAD